MGSVYAKKGRLYLSYKDANGKWRSESAKLPAGEEKAAKKKLAEKVAEVAAGLRIGSTDGKTTVRQYFLHWIETRKSQGIASAKDDETRIKLHVLPELGNMLMSDVRPRHIRDLIRKLRQKKSERGTPFAPRSVRHFYAITRRMFQDAVVDELIAATPCVLKRHDLPKKIDQDPNWRSTATFTREELEALLGDERSPEERRMLYGLMSLGSMRFGEAVARRWRDYDSEAKPLGKMRITSSFCVKTHKEKSVKTQSPREMPVHPALANMLKAWREEGWQEMLDRKPKPEDLIVPSSTGSFRNVNRGLHNLHYDLKRLGQRKRRQHDLRRTFITLARAGGARPDILKWATHGPSGDIIDIYTSLPWETLCEAVACLKIELGQSAVSTENSSTVRVPFLPSFYPQIPDTKNPEVSDTSGLSVGGADGIRIRIVDPFLVSDVGKSASASNSVAMATHRRFNLKQLVVELAKVLGQRIIIVQTGSCSDDKDESGDEFQF